MQKYVEFISYIRDFLGHVDIKSTEIYCRTDTKIKRFALHKKALNKFNRIWSILMRKGWKKDKMLSLSMTRWRNSACQMVHAALDLKWFEKIGFVSLLSVYENL